MNEAAKKWVEALESGKYQQGKGYLHVVTKDGDNLYCCLGVACALYNEEQQAGMHIQDYDEVTGNKVVSYNDHDYYLPPGVQDYLGLASANGSFGPCLASSLSLLNDKDATFKEIAEVIKRKPIGLFVE